MQSFLKTPNFDTHLFYKSPTDLYQEFSNAYAYYKQATLCNPNPNKQQLLSEAREAWKQIKNENTNIIREKIKSYLSTVPSTIRSYHRLMVNSNSNSTSTSTFASPSASTVTSLQQFDINTVAKNAVGQHNAIAKIKNATQQISEYEQALVHLSDQDIKQAIRDRMEENKKIIEVSKKKLEKLKRHAEAQAKLRSKKQRQLSEESIVEQYDKPGRPSAAILNPDIWDNIHDCVEFGSAHAKRRKTVIKVRTIKHLREALEEKYNTYLSRQCLSTYLEPRHKHTFAARRHHHPAKVGLASVARTDMKQHIDEHYCLASVKAARVFAEVFASETVVISQDDKAKISLGIPAVGRTFKTIQSVNEPVTIEDHDFPKGNKMKLVPSVYLLIDPTDSNTALRTGQLAIFVRPEYFLNTSSLTHMTDLLTLINSQEFASILLKENNVKPIWVLLVDGGPDENPKHLKNIIEYSNLFRTLDLDYLTIRTHAPYQSAYNPVERSMASLSEKLAGITLPVDEYGVHLDSQGNVVNEELARRNFEFSGKKLCEIWSRDQIYGRPVTVQYVDQSSKPFDNPASTTWEWIERHAQLCRYSLDLKKCKDRLCCSENKAPDAALLLNQNNGFLPPVTKGKNGHFVDPIHALQYFDKLKIPSYDRSCPSISKEMHQRLCCSECGKYYPTLKFIAKHKRFQHPGKRGRPRKQVDKSSLAANLVNFRVAEDAEEYNHVLLEGEASDLREIQSDIELELIEV